MSERERQIVRLGARGLTDKEIADRLAVSITTVRTYWIRLRRKLNATNRAQAIAHALQSLDRCRLKDAASRLADQPWMGIAVLDEGNKVIESNQAFRELLGEGPYPALPKDGKAGAESRWIEVGRPDHQSVKVLCTILPLGRDGRLRAAYLLPAQFQLL
ncbi:MAG: LuxR C-terminal-related transcriptional regulator [Fimbriimonas sp.]